MPVYEFLCKECGKKSEIFVKSREEKVVCSCGSENLEKLFSSFAVSQAEHSNPSSSSCNNGDCSLSQSPCSSGMCGL